MGDITTRRLNGQDEISGFELRLMGWRLTTAEILYRLPDHPGLLQSFTWQKLDLAPKYPELQKFLAFWEREIDGPLHSVRVMSADFLEERDPRYAAGSWALQ